MKLLPSLPSYRQALSALVLLLGSTASTLAVTPIGSTTFTFTATFVAGACEVTVDKANIHFSSATFADIAAAGTIGYEPQDFEIRFTGCKGAGYVPKIQVKAPGATFTDGIPLFRNNLSGPGYSQGYGVRLVQKGQTTALNDQDKIVVGTAAQNLATTPPNPLQLTASLSCGTCNPASVTPGDIEATVTFQFLYE